METSLKEIILLFLKKWKLITIVFFSAAIISSIISLSLQNHYQSVAVIKIKNSNNSSFNGLVRNLGQSFGGISSILGPQEGDMTRYVLDVLGSKTFLKVFLDEHDFLPEIMASKKYDTSSRSIIYDKKIFLTETQQWVRKPSGRRVSKPTYVEAHKTFTTKILNLTLNPDSGFITIAVEHKSPEIAFNLLSLYLKEADSFFRKRALFEANSSLEYLNNKLPRLAIKETKSSAAELIKINLNKAMVAEVSENYILEIIDKPYLPERKSWPRRTEIVLISSIVSVFLTCLFLYAKFLYRKT